MKRMAQLCVFAAVLSGCANTHPVREPSPPPPPSPPAAPEAPPATPPPPALTQPTPSPQSPAVLNTTSSSAGSKPIAPTESNVPYVVMTPYTLFNQGYQSSSSPSADYPAAYTRLFITSLLPADNQTEPSRLALYEYRQRNWFRRFFVGLHTSLNLTVKVTAGTYSATVPLVSIDHVSTKTDGEIFTRVIYHQAESSPLFLIKRDGSSNIISVRSAVKVSNQIQSGVAGAALQVAQNVAKAVAPQSAVLTTLTAQQSKNVATALDNAVNKLFSASVDEEQWSDNDIRVWGTGVNVELHIPQSESRLTGPYYSVGTWRVTFTNPRPSIFSDVEICTSPNSRCQKTYELAAAAAEKEVLPADVLQFHLTDAAGDLGTVASYIKKQDWYTSSVKTFAGSPKDADAVEFCQSLKSSIAALDLNSVDQGIVASAVVRGMNFPAPGVAVLKGASGAAACGCQFKSCPSS